MVGAHTEADQTPNPGLESAQDPELTAASELDKDPYFTKDEETLYQETRELLLNPLQSKTGTGSVLGITLVLFVVSMMRGTSPRYLVILIGVLFFHELGHWLGMQLFGYRDVKMFFIPFFGAAVTGKKEGAPQWQQAIVLLLGPMPGIILGASMLFWTLVVPNPLVRTIACWLVGLNVFNLLPLVPLDGGRLLNLVIFSRHRALESAFLVVAALAVIGMGWFFGMPLFALVGLAGLLMAPLQYKVAGAAAQVHRRWPSFPERIDAATDPQLRDLFREVRGIVKSRSNSQNLAKPCSNVMKSVHERAVARPVGLLASLALLATYGAGFVLSFASLLAFFFQMHHRFGRMH
jgi:Zn-dependent protease